jgi:hypothetical protein
LRRGYSEVLASEDLQWLADAEPTVKANLEASAAERLKNR